MPPPATPELPLTVSGLDPAGALRNDASAIDALWTSPHARVVRFHRDAVLLPDPQRIGSAWQPARELERSDRTWAFLGLAGDRSGRFAIAVADPGSDNPRTLRELLPFAHTPDLGMLVTAVALLNWHHRHPCCPRCGTATELTMSGWTRTCPADETQHFPRVDPAVIMLVRDRQDRALLGRQSRWPPGWFSTLAGFVEPGENLEAAVTREVAEEVGVEVHDVRYLASQPWPFPSSLMLGFHAFADDGDPTPDGSEIAEAIWVSRAELDARCASGEIRLPPALSISRWLIEQWHGGELPGDWSRP